MVPSLNYSIDFALPVPRERQLLARPPGRLGHLVQPSRIKGNANMRLKHRSCLGERERGQQGSICRREGRKKSRESGRISHMKGLAAESQQIEGRDCTADVVEAA